MSKFTAQEVSDEVAVVRITDTLVFTCLCLLVFALAIPFGGVDLWSRMLFSASAGMMLLAWAGVH